MNKKLPQFILKKMHDGEKIVMLTAYDAVFGALLDELDVDMILVGDSLGNVISGFETTLPVTMEQMILHSQYVTRSVSNTMVIGDMPFMSFSESQSQAVKNAGRLIKEGGVNAVKIEVGLSNIDTVRSIIASGIPVMAHIGFTPQSLYQQGGYKVQGRSEVDANNLINLAVTLQETGCFSVLVEMIPSSLAKKISDKLSIPLIGIGAGPECDGQVLVTHDLLGMLENSPPRFVKKMVDTRSLLKEGIRSFISEVRSRQFPDSIHEFK
jgi:3-methyl-2-oxobutanoate hydroxymethyltransferase